MIFDFAYTVFVFIKEYVRFPIGTFTSPAVTVIRCILATIFIISLIVVPLAAYEDKDRAFKAVMPILAESVLIVPLLVVSPVTGRCFYPPYVMFMLYSCELMKFIMQNYVNSDKVKKTVYALVIIGVAIGSVFYTVKYTQVKAFENERNSFVSARLNPAIKQSIFLIIRHTLNIIPKAQPHGFSGGTVCGKQDIKTFTILTKV